MSEFTQNYFDAPNLEGEGTHRISYLDWGNPESQKIIICVHGLTRNAHDFDYLARELIKQSYRVMAIDIPGRGDSDYMNEPMMYNYPAYMADCLALLDNFHFRTVDWIGTSMGGIIGMMIAAMSPGRIQRLVLNDVGAFIPGEGLKAILQYVSNTPMEYESREAAEAQLRQNMATFGIDEEEHWQHLFKYSIKEKEGRFALAFDPKILAPIKAETQNFTVIQDVNLAELWEGVDIPTLILRGEKSVLLEPETVSAMRRSNIKAQAVEIPNVGHAPTLLKPSEIQQITSWLGGSALSPSNLRAS